MTEGKPVVLVLRYIRYLQEELASVTESPTSQATSVPCILRLVRSDYRQKVVTLKELACCVVAEEVRAASNVIVDESEGANAELARLRTNSSKQRRSSKLTFRWSFRFQTLPEDLPTANHT